MGRLRGRIQKAQRESQAETVVLSCPQCGEEMAVAQDTDLEYIAYQWTLQSGQKSHRETPADVFVITNHRHDAENLIAKATGKRWLERLENAGGHYGA
jgi:hypothetical protein